MRNAFPGVLWAGLAAGILDLSAAVATYAVRGVKPVRVFQGIASGLLGRASFAGGNESAVLGVALHFVIAFCAATAFYALTKWNKLLLQRPVPSGLLYGVAVYLVMTFIVVPLSRASSGAFTLGAFILGVGIHMLLVGLPISLILHKFSKPYSRPG